MSYARQERRNLCDCLALVRPTSGEAEVVRVTDLSMHGLGVRSYQDLEVGSKVTVTLQTAPPTTVEAEVVWARPEHGPARRAGLRLEFDSELQAARLRGIVASLRPDTPTIPLRLPFTGASR